MPTTPLTRSILPTDYGPFTIVTFKNEHVEAMPHVALIHNETKLDKSVLVRVHSECMTGDLFGSQRCDCGPQLEKSMTLLGVEKGILIYLRQEGRGIGLINKMKAYNAQDEGLDTLEANVHLGFEPDERDYEIAIDILKSLKVSAIRLLTNNPEKMHAFDNSGISLEERIPLIIKANDKNQQYLETKQKKFGHLLK